MNITFYSNVTSRDSVLAQLPQLAAHTLRFFKLDQRDALLQTAADTEILLLDAMGVADKTLLDGLPHLRLIQSEGVGYQGVDLACVQERGIALCNNKGVNDTAVAEDALLLMLGCLKSIITGHQSVYDGRQIAVKQASFGVIRELSECTVGLIGFGDIARATAKFAAALGANILYTNRTRYAALEADYHATYVTQEELLAQSDFVSLHVAVTDETRHMVNADFLRKMQPHAYLINTARGDLVDNAALLQALLDEEIAGAGLDVISPEPVTADNILLDARIRDKLVLTPHIAGITSLTVQKIYRNIYDNIERLCSGAPLRNQIL